MQGPLAAIQIARPRIKSARGLRPSGATNLLKSVWIKQIRKLFKEIMLENKGLIRFKIKWNYEKKCR
jgi:hypothetical protein